MCSGVMVPRRPSAPAACARPAATGSCCPRPPRIGARRRAEPALPPPAAAEMLPAAVEQLVGDLLLIVAEARIERPGRRDDLIQARGGPGQHLLAPLQAFDRGGGLRLRLVLPRRAPLLDFGVAVLSVAANHVGESR